jgi:hypothetical protein
MEKERERRREKGGAGRLRWPGHAACAAKFFCPPRASLIASLALLRLSSSMTLNTPPPLAVTCTENIAPSLSFAFRPSLRPLAIRFIKKGYWLLEFTNSRSLWNKQGLLGSYEYLRKMIVACSKLFIISFLQVVKSKDANKNSNFFLKTNKFSQHVNNSDVSYCLQRPKKPAPQCSSDNPSTASNHFYSRSPYSKPASQSSPPNTPAIPSQTAQQAPSSQRPSAFPEP